MNIQSKTIKDLIVEDIQHKTLEEMLFNHTEEDDDINDYKGYSGVVFESLFDICFTFGLIEEVEMLSGKVEYGIKLKKLRNIYTDYLQGKWNKGNADGKVDIKFSKINSPTLIALSSKYYKREKPADKYDISKMLHLISKNPFYKNNFELGVCVRDKKEFLEKAAFVGNDTIRKDCKYIYDQKDLQIYYNRLKQLLSLYNYDLEKLCDEYLNDRRKLFTPHKFQNYLADMATETLKRGENGIVMCKPRIGKSYIMMKTVLNIFNQTTARKIFITTPIKATIPDFTKISKTEEFRHIKCYVIEGDSKFINIDPKQYEIFISSKQLFSIDNDSEQDGITKWNNIFPHGINIDYMIIDEAHLGCSTKNAKRLVNDCIQPKAILFSTGTPFKPVLKWSILEKNRFGWDDEDLIEGKRGNLDLILRKHPKLIDYDLDPKIDLIDVFNEHPNLYMFTSSVPLDDLKTLEREEGDFGYSPTKMMSYNSELQLIHENDFRYAILDQLYSKENNNCVYKRVQNTPGSRFNFRSDRYFPAQLWALPIGQGLTITQTQIAVKNAIENYDIPFWKKFTVIMTNDNKMQEKCYVKYIKNEIKRAQANKKYVIILTGDKGLVGISIKSIDLVLNLSNKKNMDSLFQMLNRAGTPDYENNKKSCFYVDLFFDRCIRVNYDIADKIRPNLSITGKFRFLQDLIEVQDINIDIKDESGSHVLIDKCVKKYITNQVNRTITEIKGKFRLDNKYINKEIIKGLKIPKNFKDALKIEVQKERVKKGKDREKIINNGEEDLNEEKGEEDLNEEACFQIIFESFIALILFFTLDKRSTYELSDLLYNVEENEEKLNMLYLILKVKFELNNNIILDNMIELIHSNNKLNNKLRNEIHSFKSKMIEAETEIDRLDIVHQLLPPERNEQKKLGEVFTPLKLVNEMLDKLPEEVWTNKDLKWLEPAGGFGNFNIVVYSRLMKGLKGVIKDNKKRERWIKTKMLYYNEYNIKNVEVYKYLMESSLVSREELNIHYGDYLTLDIKDYWGVEKFDIIVGNPPYQSTYDNSKRKKMWVEFSKKSIKICDILLFITPSTWQQKSKYFTEIYNLISKYLSFYLNNIEDFNVGESIGYWLYNKLDTNIIDIKEENVYRPIYNKMLRKGESWHYRDHQQPYGKDKVRFPSTSNKEFNTPIYWTANQIRYCKREDISYSGWKVIVNNSGTFYNEKTPNKYVKIDNDMTVGLGAWGIKIPDYESGKNVVSWVSSKLYRTIVTKMKTGGFNNPFVELENLGYNKKWTDEEIYKYFNLTEEEIKLIENTITPSTPSTPSRSRSPTVNQLKQQCKDKGIKGYSNLKKQQLIELLEKN